MLDSKSFLKRLPYLAFFFIFVLLVLHLFKVPFVAVDNMTILLILLLLLSPLSNSLKKIKWGDFEAEIQQAEVEKIGSKVKELPESDPQKPYEINETIEDIFSVLDQDHILALAKIRIELEKVLSKILSVVGNSQKRPLGLSNILRSLEGADLFDKQFIPPIRDVVAISNRAIHGEEVEKEIAKKIIDVGAELLWKLYRELYNLLSKPTNSEVISPRERDEYINATYHVTTVVPLINEDEPYINRYIFNQEQLSQFLENYGEVAEFLVEIKKIGNRS